MAGFYQPPTCKCFGGYCMKQFGCPNKPPKGADRKQVEEVPAKCRVRRREGYLRGGKLVETQVKVLTWKPEE